MEPGQLTIGSLFSGYGGLDLAVSSVTGARTVWVSDIDKGACKILAHRFPDIPNLGDLTKIDWDVVEPVDIITGGFPCQDLSHAGKRAGMAGARSGLWSYMCEAINVIRPRLVVAENVRGLLSANALRPVESCTWCVGDEPSSDLRALGAVLADLADIGYDAQWFGFRASDVGACHGRFREFIAAYPRGQARREWPRLREAEPTGGRRRQSARGSGTSEPLTTTQDDLLPTPATMNGKSKRAMTASTDNGRRSGGGQSSPPGLDEVTQILSGQWPDNMPDVDDLPPAGGDSQQSRSLPAMAIRGELASDIQLMPTTTGMDAHSSGMGTGTTLTDALERGRDGIVFGVYERAVERWERAGGRAAPPPTEPTGKSGSQRLSPRFTEWMMGLPDGWITDVPGISRIEALKACGNGVVPLQAAVALRHMLATSSPE